jgi:arsenate reductase
MIQIFGTKKSADTRRAERWFRERGVALQIIDLRDKGLSPGELRSVAQAVGGIEQLIDREGTAYRDLGLRAAAPTGPRIEQWLLDKPLLLRMPIVRDGKRATVGIAEDKWKMWLAAQ